MLQSLQQMSSTFAGIVTAFCNSLQWPTLSLVVSQFKERLFFGIHRDLIDLMRLPDLNHKRARALFDSGITTLVDLANADIFEVEKVLYNALSFDSTKQHDNEAAYEAEQRNQARDFFITGKVGLTVAEGAKLLVQEARNFVQYEIGVGAIKWTQERTNETSSMDSLHMSSEENDKEYGVKRNGVLHRNLEETEVTPPKLKRLENDPKQHSILNEKPSTNKNISTKNKSTVMEYSSLNSKQKQGKGDAPKMLTTQTNNAFNIKEMEKSVAMTAQHQNGLLLAATTTKNINIKEKENPITVTGEAQRRSGSLAVVAAAKCINVACNKENSGTSTANQVSAADEKVNVLQKINKVVDKNKVVEKYVHNLKIVATDLNRKTMKNEQIMKTVNIETKKYALRKSCEAQTILAPRTKDNAKITQISKTHANRHNAASSLKQTTSTKNKPNSLKQSPQANQLIRTAPRRSPRNHERNSDGKKPANVEPKAPPTPLPQHSFATKNSSSAQKHFDQSLFLADDSFELNTGINAALEAANNQLNDAPTNTPNTVNKGSDDEIAETQQILQAVIDSPVQAKHSVHASRLLRTTQRLRAAQKSTITKVEPSANAHPSSSIEVSDLSLENSLLKHPLQLNATHILNCTTIDDASTNFKRLEIVDICGDHKLFNAALRELIKVKRFGFCIGLQQQANKCKPLIGGNLLLNQRAGSENMGQRAIAKEFQIDDHTYLAGCAFGIAENVVYYMNMQPEDTCANVNTEMKCKFLSSLLTTGECTLLCVDAKEQLKILCRILGELSELRVNLEDPKEANWLLQPDKFMNFQQMVRNHFKPCFYM